MLLVAERLRYLFAESSLEHDGARSAATASFGGTAVNFSGDIEGVTEEAIIAAADRLLYQAKSAGRNNVQSEELICSMQA
jgi:PleD family two-component response regulator